MVLGLVSHLKRLYGAAVFLELIKHLESEALRVSMSSRLGANVRGVRSFRSGVW